MPPDSASAPPKLDLDHFQKKSNATLYRIEKISLVLLTLSGLLGYFLFQQKGLSALIGGGLGMFHFRALHRMSQRRIIAPELRLKTQFLYSLKLFLIIALFFWIRGLESLSSPLVIAGFFLSTISVLIDGKRSKARP